MEVFNLAEKLEEERKKNKELQEKIDKSIKYIVNLQEKNKKYNERIDNALSYIEEHIEDKWGKCDTHYIWQVASILKGGNNNE